jgi:hypothetical protein
MWMAVTDQTLANQMQGAPLVSASNQLYMVPMTLFLEDTCLRPMVGLGLTLLAL